MKKEGIYILLIGLLPAVVVWLTWMYLSPDSFWQKLVMLIVSIIEYVGVAYIVLQICEVIDRWVK